MRMTWAVVCRKANGEKLVESHGELMTSLQASLTPLGQPEHHLPPQPARAAEDSTIITLGIDHPPEPIQPAQPTTPTIPTAPFPLLSLNYDCRRAVLETIFPRTTLPVFLRGNNGRPRTAVPLPPIVSTNKQLRLEALLCALNQTEIEIHSGAGNIAFQDWLALINFRSLHGDISSDITWGFDAIHRLSFPYFSRFQHRTLPAGTENDDVMVIVECKQLRELKLWFVGQELYDAVTGVEKGAEQLRAEYRLDEILEMTTLKKILLVGPLGEDGDKGLLGLGKWFKEGFELAGKKVEVVP